MPNPENLRPPWKPGQSGNPAGYSRNRRISDALSKLIDEKGADGALATVWLRKALEGNPVFFSMLLDRIEGKVPTMADEPPATATPTSKVRDHLPPRNEGESSSIGD